MNARRWPALAGGTLQLGTLRLLPRRLPLPAWLRNLLAVDSPLWGTLIIIAPPVAAFLWLVRAEVDPDYWWHLATGRWILAHQRVPLVDPFSWTHAGQPWIAHEWLAELLMALADRAGGYAAALLLTVAIVCCGYWLLLRAAALYGLSRRTLCLLMLLWGGIPLVYIAVRPQVWSWALLGLLIEELAAHDTGRRRRLWPLVALFLVWVNLNLTAFIGLAILGAYALSRLLSRRLDRHLLFVCVLSAGCVVVNPQGLGLVRLAISYAEPGMMNAYQFIGEWQAPLLSAAHLLPFWLATPLVIVALWKLFRWPPPIWPCLPVAVFLEEALRASRYVPIYGLLLLPFAGWLAWQARPQAAPTPRPAFARPDPGWLLPAGVAAALLLVFVARQPQSQFHRVPDPRGYPAAAAMVLLQQQPDAKLFNSYNWGGYLIERLGPEIPIFIDGRTEMYGTDFVTIQRALMAARPGWQNALNSLGVDAVLIEPDSPLAAAISHDPQWHLAYQDDVAVLYTRSGQGRS